MKSLVLFVPILVLVTAADDVNVASSSTMESSQQLLGGNNFGPLHNKRQEKRYIPYTGAGSYGGYGGYSSAIDSNIGYQNGYYNPNRLDSYTGGYNGYNSAYAGYGNYNINPYQNSYYNSRLGGYPYPRPGYGYNSYPSSYYSSNYANSIVGGGLGGLGPAGVPVSGALGSGYQYGPGISSSIY